MSRPDGRWLPRVLTWAFALYALWLVVHELGPAFAEHHRATALLAEQERKVVELEKRIEARRRLLRSLAEDPQTIERVLDRAALRLDREDAR